MKALNRSTNFEQIHEHQHQREALIRSKNFLDLNDQNLDALDESLNLNRSNSSNDSTTRLFEMNSEAAYVNFGTQTSFSDDIALGSEEQLDLNPERSGAKQDIESEYTEIDPQICDDFDNTKSKANLKCDQKESNQNQEQFFFDDHPPNRFQKQQRDEQNPNFTEQAQINQGSTYCGQKQRVDLLRQLLAIERNRNEQRRCNNQQLSRYLNQLQTDYLRLQQDLIETLELGHKVKAQKEAQLENMNEALRQKNLLIEQLNSSLDETQVRKEFKELLDKQSRLANVEKQQLREQVETIEQQLVRERVNSSQILQQFQTRLDDQVKAHSSEIENYKDKIFKLETELDKLMNEPKNLVIKELREDNEALKTQIDELQLNVNESQQKYQLLTRRLENLSNEQKATDQKTEQDIKLLQNQIGDQRKVINDLTFQVEERDEQMQLAQFNLQRSERRSVNLLSILKEKEDTYKKMVEEINNQSGQSIDKLRGEMRSLERKLLEQGDLIEKKQNEIVRLEMERENQLESLRNDRDERLKRSDSMKQKLQKQLESLEIKMAREMEINDQRNKLIQDLQKDALHFKEEAKKLSLELTKSQAKLFANQQELNRLEKQLAERESNNISLDSSKEQLVSLELDKTRRHAGRLEATIRELKDDNERLGLKLKVNEATMSKLSAAINQEHVRLAREYEYKLEQIKQDQGAFDRNKMRYKRYGYKLRKYCEHLRRVHEHLCNPETCGYLIEDSAPYDASQINSSDN